MPTTLDMIGSTLQVRTRAQDSSWQENVALQALSEPDYSGIPQKPHVEIQIHESKSSLGSSKSSIEQEILRRKVWLFFRGFTTSVGLEKDTSPWAYAVLVAVVLAILYWVLAWGSLYFIYSDFALVWPPNGIYIGGVFRTGPRARRVMVVTMALAVYTVNLAWGNGQLKAAGFTIFHPLECLLTTSIAFGLINVFYPKKLSLLHRKHLISIAVAIFAACTIMSNVNAAYFIGVLFPAQSYSTIYLKFIGRDIVGSALIVPVVLSTHLPYTANGKIRQVPKACLLFVR